MTETDCTVPQSDLVFVMWVYTRREETPHVSLLYCTVAASKSYYRDRVLWRRLKKGARAEGGIQINTRQRGLSSVAALVLLKQEGYTTTAAETATKK